MIEIVSAGNKASQTALRNFVTKSAEMIFAGVKLAVEDVIKETNEETGL